ncbi:hypothetical protein BDN72DRAFT_498190 [Pluteus cervinus]|uniref:Uncharacterized protein n=1 Tax=Pluteus cervinus TaxID=181527 RepID=A0ACD3A545_9AGAR|nr:hypothetical protein BDN72DRAFT_498190 [Pluteus cervinus]
MSTFSHNHPLDTSNYMIHSLQCQLEGNHDRKQNFMLFIVVVVVVIVTMRTTTKSKASTYFTMIRAPKIYSTKTEKQAHLVHPVRSLPTSPIHPSKDPRTPFANS